MSIVTYAMPVRKFTAKLNTPKWEATKTVIRWVIFFIVASVITDILKQIEVIPERACWNLDSGLLCFTIREKVKILLTLALGYVETYTHRANKMDHIPSGILPV